MYVVEVVMVFSRMEIRLCYSQDSVGLGELGVGSSTEPSNHH